MNPEPSPSFEEPLAMLQAAHERIEVELASLERLTGRREGKSRNAEARSAAQGILEYFDASGALHHQDEEDDLFPLLRERAAARGRAEIAAVIEELEREHATMNAQWLRLRERLAQIAAGEGSLDADEVARFAWVYRRHMEYESAAVLPFAKEALDRADRAALGERMAARRESRLAELRRQTGSDAASALERELDHALEETFPASDPVAVDTADEHAARHKKNGT